MDERRTITRADYYALHGLLALAAGHNAALSDIEIAACKITGEAPRDGGHTGDALMEAGSGSAYDHGAAWLLERLSIDVEPEE